MLIATFVNGDGTSLLYINSPDPVADYDLIVFSKIGEPHDLYTIGISNDKIRLSQMMRMVKDLRDVDITKALTHHWFELSDPNCLEQLLERIKYLIDVRYRAPRNFWNKTPYD